MLIRHRFARPGRSMQQRAWSRAGAVAVVLAAGPTRRVLAFSTRVMLLVMGSVAIAVSVAVTLWTGLGPGPLDVFIGAVRVHTGLPLSVAVWLVVGSLIAIAWALGRRPGLGTLVGPFLVGVVLQTTLSLLQTFASPSSLIVRLVLQLLAIGGIGIGAGALIVSGLGAGSGELLASAASDRSGHPEPWIRFAFEMSWLVIGVAMGGPAGLGTIIVALTIGWSVSNGYRIVDGVVAGLFEGLVGGFRRARSTTGDDATGMTAGAEMIVAAEGIVAASRASGEPDLVLVGASN